MARRNASGEHVYTRTAKLRGREQDGRYAVIVQSRDQARIARLRPDGSADSASEELVPSSELMEVRPTRVVPTGQRGTLTIPGEFRRELGIEEGTLLQIIQEEDGRLTIRPLRAAEEEPVESLEELLARVTPENIHEAIPFDGPVGREVW
jgi:antitoxin MazE